MPDSEFEILLKGVRLPAPSLDLEEAIGRMLSGAGTEAGGIEQTLEVALEGCAPASPSPELESCLAAELPSMEGELQEIERLLYRLEPAAFRADFEDDLEIELAEDLAFEAWLSEARPKPQGVGVEKFVGAQIEMHVFEGAPQEQGPPELLSLREKGVVAPSRAGWTAALWASVGVAAAFVIGVQVDFWGARTGGGSAVEPTLANAEAGEVFKNRSENPGSNALNTPNRVVSSGGGRERFSAKASPAVPQGPREGKPLSESVPLISGGALPRNIQEALGAMESGEARGGTPAQWALGANAVGLREDVGEREGGGVSFGARLTLAPATPAIDTGKVASNPGTPSGDAGKVASNPVASTGAEGSPDSMLKALADGDFGKVFPPDVLKILSDLPALALNGPAASSVQKSPTKMEELSFVGAEGTPLLRSATVSGDVKGEAVFVAGISGSSVPSRLEVSGPVSSSPVSLDGSGADPVGGGRVVPLPPVAVPEVTIFTKTDGDYVLCLREKGGIVTAEISGLGVSGGVRGEILEAQNLVNLALKVQKNEGVRGWNPPKGD